MEYEHRRFRLKELITALYGNRRGSIRTLAAACEMDESYVGRLLYEPHNKHHKNIGDKAIADLSKGLGLPPGWFDHPLGALLNPEEWQALRAQQYTISDKNHAVMAKEPDVLLSVNSPTDSCAAQSPASQTPAWPFAPIDPERYHALSAKGQRYALGQFALAIAEAEQMFGDDRAQNVA